MTKLKLELNFNPGTPQETADFARQAEALGYYRLGIWDSPALFREPWITLAAVAQATSRIKLGTNVTNPLTRHPVVTASAAATLDELAPGRIYIGIGSGDSGVYNLGFTGSPMAHLREYILTVRKLLEEGEAEYQGKQVLLTWVGRKHIPIYLSAHGPRAVRLAGEVADGVIMGLGISPEVIRGSLGLLEQGAKQAGRDVNDIDVWWVGGISIDPRPGEALRQSAWVVSSPNHHLARFTMNGKFIPEKYKAGIKQLAEAYDITTHGKTPQDQRDSYDRLAQELGVRDYLMDRFLTAGTPREVEQKLRERMEAGATQFSAGTAVGAMSQARRLADLAKAMSGN